MQNRTNKEWLADLQGDQQDQALEDLRAILIRGLRYALSSRLKTKLDMRIEDFVQDALLRILDNLHTFRGESKFTTWAQKIAVRVAYTELRRQRWKDISLQDLLPEDDSGDFVPEIMSDPGPDPEQNATQQNMLTVVSRLINEELTERQRNAITAIIIGGMPIEEVAHRMDTNRNALYKLIHDARKRLKERLKSEGLTTGELLAVFETT